MFIHNFPTSNWYFVIIFSPHTPTWILQQMLAHNLHNVAWRWFLPVPSSWWVQQLGLINNVIMAYCLQIAGYPHVVVIDAVVIQYRMCHDTTKSNWSFIIWFHQLGNVSVLLALILSLVSRWSPTLTWLKMILITV